MEENSNSSKMETSTATPNATEELDRIMLLYEKCEATLMDESITLPIMLLLAVIFLSILMIAERRATYCCKGRCGILMSVNFLENKTNRSMIVAAFILTTLDVLGIIFGMEDDEMEAFPKIIKVILRIITVTLLSFIYLPLFHCISEHTLLRQCLGLCYICTIVPLNWLSSTTVCHYPELPLALLAEHAAESLIVLSAGGFIACKFTYRIVRMVKAKWKASPPPPQEKDPYQVQYIKNLLKKQTSINGGLPTKEKIAHRMRRYLYKNIPGFRYSISILISVFLGVLLFIMMISILTGVVLDIYFALWHMVQINRHDLNGTMPNVVVEIAKLLASHSEGESSTPTDSFSVAVFFETQLNCLCASYFLAASLAAFQVCSTVVYMLKGYRKNVLSLYRQELDDNVMEGVNNVDLVVNAIQFGGYQVAHMIYGYILQLVVFFILFLLFVELIVFPVLFNYWGVIWSLLGWLGPIFFIKFVSRWIQQLLVRRAFLINSGSVFGIDNRKCFFNMMFFMFFYNIFSGLVSCVLRVIKLTILGVWFFPRLDRSIFPHSFEKYDVGYRAYVCLLKLEERQNNVILLSFVELLTEKCCRTTNESKKYCEIQEEERSVELNEVKRKHSRNRWFLAWTLMHNTSLQSERRGTITSESTDV